MNPIQVKQTLRTNQIQRNVMCRHYNKCLDMAVEMDWKGFACSECPDYELEAGEDQLHWLEQEWRAAYLLLRIVSGDPWCDSWVEPGDYRACLKEQWAEPLTHDSFENMFAKNMTLM